MSSSSRDAAVAWLDAAAPGYCSPTDFPPSGDCRTGQKGSFALKNRTSKISWLDAVEECISYCLGCERCTFMTVAILSEGLWAPDCSWYDAAGCSRPKEDGVPVGSFFHGLVPRGLPPPAPATRRTRLEVPLSRINRSVAIQLSGHLMHCNYASVALHLRACRARFVQCELFVHTWSTMAPKTIHWSNTFRKGASTSSAACVAKLREELQPAEVLVEEQGMPFADDSLAPDGANFTERHVLGWGPGRYFGYMQALHGMGQSSKLRRKFERRTSAEHTVAVRIRPDDRAKSGYSGLSANEMSMLWACIQAKERGAGSRRGTRSAHTGTNPPLGVLVGCNVDATLSVGSTGNDNCFFGAPHDVDALLGVFERNASVVYTEAKRRNLSLSRHESALLPVAAELAHLRLAKRAYTPGMLRASRAPLPEETSCHLDDVRLLLLPEAGGLMGGLER